MVTDSPCGHVLHTRTLFDSVKSVSNLQYFKSYTPPPQVSYSLLIVTAKELIFTSQNQPTLISKPQVVKTLPTGVFEQNLNN